MQCQRCNRPATVHLTEVVHGEKIERHLCEVCAQKEGIALTTTIPLTDLLLGSVAEAQQEARSARDLTCPYCQMTWAKFRRTGLLGCPHDYEVFREALRPLLKRAHDGALEHVGRIPAHSDRAARQVQQLRLREELRRAVEAEDYETAARLRDELNQLVDGVS